MFNKSKKAIRILNKHMTDLGPITNVLQGNTWKASLKDTLNLYIGSESSISKRLDEIYFTRKESRVSPGIIGIFTENVYDDSQKENFKDLIQSAIKHIESNGVYKNESRKNFLGGFSNTEIISGIVVSIGIVFGIGNYLGKLEKDRQIIESESKIKDIEKKYQDSIKENYILKTQLEKQTSKDLTKDQLKY
jgi:hypothetical protein